MGYEEFFKKEFNEQYGTVYKYVYTYVYCDECFVLVIFFEVIVVLCFDWL